MLFVQKNIKKRCMRKIGARTAPFHSRDMAGDCFSASSLKGKRPLPYPRAGGIGHGRATALSRTPSGLTLAAPLHFTS